MTSKKTALAALALVALTSVSTAAFAQSNIAGRNRPEGLAPIAPPAAKLLGPNGPTNNAFLAPATSPELKTRPSPRPTSTKTQIKDRPADALHGVCATGGGGGGRGGGGGGGVGGWCR